MVNFVLNYLSSSVSMDISGEVYAQPITAVDASATAIFQVSLDDIKKVFQFQTNSNFDINNLPADIRYYVDPTFWPALNPANGMMDNAASNHPIITGDSNGVFASNKMLVAHDFVRYLALSLFNSAYGAGLFDNENDLLTDLRWICGNSQAGQTWYDIVSKLTAVSESSGTNADLVADENGKKYLTDKTATEVNLGRTLFEQLTGSAINRFSSIQGGDAPQALPFQANDSISFKLTIAAAPGQEQLTGVSPVVPRSYEVKMILVESPSNTAVASDEVASPTAAPAPTPVETHN